MIKARNEGHIVTVIRDARYAVSVDVAMPAIRVGNAVTPGGWVM